MPISVYTVAYYVYTGQWVVNVGFTFLPSLECLLGFNVLGGVLGFYGFENVKRGNYPEGQECAIPAMVGRDTDLGPVEGLAGCDTDPVSDNRMRPCMTVTCYPGYIPISITSWSAISWYIKRNEICI